MRCPTCGKKLIVENTYDAGTHVKTQRLRCSSKTCFVIATARVEIVNIDPDYGQGASALAKKIIKEKTP